MQVLVIDASFEDKAVLGALRQRGFEVTVIRSAVEALSLIEARAFDCVLVDVSTAGESLQLADVRRLMTRAAISLMTAGSLESLMLETVADGSIEFRSFADIIENLGEPFQPVLLVAPDFHPILIDAIRGMGLRVSFARTLPFMMNLLVDGWCQVVCLNAQMHGKTGTGEVAIVHTVSAKQLAILAAGLDSAGITLSNKPHNAEEFIAVIERVTVNRAVPCGLTDSFRGRLHN